MHVHNAFFLHLELVKYLHAVMSKTANTANSGFTADAFVLPGEQDKMKLWNNILMGSFLLIFILMTVMSFSYGLSGDEVDMNEYGKAILKYFTSFGSDQTVLNMPKEYNRDGVMQFYGGFFDLICAIVNKFSPYEEYTTRHILNAWAGFLAIFFAAKITARLLGRQAAVLCSWLMFAAPFFLGHAMNNPKDVPFATAYIAAIYAIIIFFDNMPKPAIKHYVWTILAIGITIDIRVGGILLLPYLFVYAGLIYISKQWFGNEKVDLKAFVKPIAILAVLGYLAGSIFWPYAHKNPISNPLTALSEMSNFKVSIAQLYEGEKIPSNELPGNFLIKSFIITNSYVLLTGIALALAFIFSFRKHPKGATIWFVIFTGLFPILYVIYSKANVYHGWRHVMFAFPSLAVTATAGWYALSKFMAEKNIKYTMLAPALLLLEPVGFIATTFPNTICYFNAFAGGVQGAYTNYEMDYYYNSVKQDVDYFKKNELPKIKPGDTVEIASNCAHLLLQYFKDVKNVRITYVRFPERDQKKWDYSIFHIALIPAEEVKSKSWLAKTTLFTAAVKDCPLSALAKRPSYDDYKGFEALNQNKVDTALMYFNNYLNADPNNVEMLSLMANIYHQLQRDDLAQQYMVRAKRLIETTPE
jgi:hypothetical protein